VVGKLFKVVFSRKSQKQLKDISDYVAKNASPTQARKVRRAIKKAGDNLAHLPESKPILPGTEHLPKQIRYTKKWSFKIIFRVLKSVGIVRVLGIRHDKEAPDDIKGNL
jgi:plasmid stabilization system protein ParE